MPQDDVDPWLAASFPDRLMPGDPEFDQYAHCDATLCMTVLRDPMAATTKGAYDIGADVTYQPGGTALIGFSATDY